METKYGSIQLGQGTNLLAHLGESHMHCTGSGIYNLFYPSQGEWKRLSEMCKQMGVEKLQGEVWDSNQVLIMGAQEAETGRGEGKRCSGAFLGKVEGWEETDVKGKLFRASSTGKYVLVKAYLHTIFQCGNQNPSQQLSIVEFWWLKVKGIKLS